MAELEKKGSADFYLSKKRLISRLKSYKNAVRESAVELNLKKEEIKAQKEIAEAYSLENERLKEEITNRKEMEDKIKEEILLMEKEHQLHLTRTEEIIKEKESLKNENLDLKNRVDYSRIVLDAIKKENTALKESVKVLCNVALDVEEHLKKKNLGLKDVIDQTAQEVESLRKENAELKDTAENHSQIELLFKELKEELESLKNIEKISVAVQTTQRRRNLIRRLMTRPRSR